MLALVAFLAARAHRSWFALKTTLSNWSLLSGLARIPLLTSRSGFANGAWSPTLTLDSFFTALADITLLAALALETDDTGLPGGPLLSLRASIPFFTARTIRAFVADRSLRTCRPRLALVSLVTLGAGLAAITAITGITLQPGRTV